MSNEKISLKPETCPGCPGKINKGTCEGCGAVFKYHAHKRKREKPSVFSREMKGIFKMKIGEPSKNIGVSHLFNRRKKSL